MPRIVLFLCLAASSWLAFAQQPLTVVLKEAPPFVIKGTDGSWTGPAIDIWQHAASVLGVEYVYKELSLKQMLDAVENAQADVAVGALSVTAAREHRFDFTHPFHTTGFGIATREVQGNTLLSLLDRMLSSAFLTAAGALLLILFLTGLVVFLLERRRNPEQFGGGWLRGIGSGFWWSAVTMTTVGYGDKAPQTLGGRFIAIIWMFVAVITISGFTASIASSLTVERLTAVKGADDLVSARVGTVGGSSSEEYLRGERLSPRVYDTLPAALAELAVGGLDAVVYDLPLLAYQLERNPKWETVSLLPETLTSQQYAFAVPNGSALRESLNRIIPEFIHTEAWRKKVEGY